MTKIDVYPIVVPNSYGLKTVNFYLVKHGNHLTLIDAGYNDKDSWNALQEKMNECSFSLFDMTEIILTHHHIDHMGLVNRIIDRHPIPIYCSPLAIPRLKKDKHYMKVRKDFFIDLYEKMDCGNMGKKHIAHFEEALNKNYEEIKGDLIPINKETLFSFDCINIPGHSPDQIGLLHKEDRFMISGDLLIEHISSNAIVEPDEKGNRLPSLMQHIHSLKKCAALNIETIYPGHGNPIKEPNILIQKRLKRIEEKSDRIFYYIQNGFRTGQSLAIKMYADKYKKEFGLVMSEIIGHLDYLEMKKRITKVLKNGVWYYETIENFSKAAN